MGKTRKLHSSKTKLEAAIAMASGKNTVSELCQKYGVHPTAVQRWKKELMESGAEIFVSSNWSEVICQEVRTSSPWRVQFFAYLLRLA